LEVEQTAFVWNKGSNMNESKQRILVIGGVACGPKAASRVKRLLPHADVTIYYKDGGE